MSDLSLGDPNESTSVTTLSGRSDDDGSFSGDVVLHVSADVLADHFVHGIRGVGYGDGGVGVVGVGARGAEVGVLGEGEEIGVIGRLTDNPSSLPPTFDNAGVLGSSFGDKLGAGVIGETDVACAVYGDAKSGIGVRGDSETGVGVLGESTGDGVVGSGDRNGVRGTGRVGTFGEAANDKDIGAIGTSRGFVGVYGVTEGGVGVSGYSASGIGVQAQTDHWVAIVASSHDKSGKNTGLAAGVFLGPVFVEGDLTVTGAKSAGVRQRDGSHRLFYSIESPESWFEDFGEAKLVDGRTTVQLDSGFSSAVMTDSYHVFLTPYGDSNGLYVSRRGKRGFEVREQGKGKSNIPFSYRVVAKRKDIEGKRLAGVQLPKVQPISVQPDVLGNGRELLPRPKRRERKAPVDSK